MKSPGIFHIRSIALMSQNMLRLSKTGEWVPARPEGYPSIFHRFRAAWLVFTGRADALVWDETTLTPADRS